LAPQLKETSLAPDLMETPRVTTTVLMKALKSLDQAKDFSSVLMLLVKMMELLMAERLGTCLGSWKGFH